MHCFYEAMHCFYAHFSLHQIENSSTFTSDGIGWDRERLIFRVEATKTGVPLELPVTRQLAALLERRWEESGTLPEG